MTAQDFTGIERAMAAATRAARPQDRQNSNVCRVYADALRDADRPEDAAFWNDVANFLDVYQAYLIRCDVRAWVSAEIVGSEVHIRRHRYDAFPFNLRGAVKTRTEFKIDLKTKRIHLSRSGTLASLTVAAFAADIDTWNRPKD